MSNIIPCNFHSQYSDYTLQNFSSEKFREMVDSSKREIKYKEAKSMT